MYALTKSEADRLMAHPYLTGIPRALVEPWLRFARWLHVPAGAMVLDFDDTTTEVFFVIQGSVRVVVRTADGERTQILGDLQDGDLMGEMAALDHVPRSARAEALVNSTLCAMPGAVIRELMVSSPPVMLRLLQMLSRRVRLQNLRLLEHTALSTRARLEAELLRLSRPRADGTRVVSPPPTHEVLASRIGARRETVSRELSAMTHAGHLRRTRSAIVLTDPLRFGRITEI